MHRPAPPASPGKRSRDSPEAIPRAQTLLVPKTERIEDVLHREHDSNEVTTIGAAQNADTAQRHQYMTIDGLSRAHEKQVLLSKKQQRLVGQWYEDFAQPALVPLHSDEYIVALAKAIQAQPQLVLQYIEQRRERNGTTENSINTEQQERLSCPSLHSTDPNIEPYSLTQANEHLDPTTLIQVEKYVSACRRRRSQNDGRRSVNTGPYRCTFGCGYRTKRAFDWRRHEETHEPQELWLCTICTSNNPFLVNRKDKFLKHVTDKHMEHTAEQVLDKSKVAFVPRVELGCTICDVASSSWDERCRHVLGHFEDEVEREIKRVRVTCDEGEDGNEPDRSENGSVSVSLKSGCDGNEVRV
jgi:hypothetical protein